MPVRRLLYIMGKGYDLPQFGIPTSLGADPDLVPAMAYLYAEALRHAVRGGLLRDYRRVEEALVAVRGRLDLMALGMRRFGVLPPLDCAFDEYDVDAEPNRRLLAAALLLGRAVGGPIGAELFSLATRFEGVAEVVYRTAPRALDLDRRWTRYGSALPLADLVLRSGSIDLRHGTVAAAEFLVDMNRVYEQFVVRSLGSAIGGPKGRWAYHPAGLALDSARRLSMTPDALLRDDKGRPAVVVDAKYKFTGGEGALTDIYQMVAYCTALGAREAVLVYAGCSKETVHAIRASDIRVHVVRLDPDGEPAEIQVRVAALSARIAQIASGSAPSTHTLSGVQL